MILRIPQCYESKHQFRFRKQSFLLFCRKVMYVSRAFLGLSRIFQHEEGFTYLATLAKTSIALMLYLTSLTIVDAYTTG